MGWFALEDRDRFILVRLLFSATRMKGVSCFKVLTTLKTLRGGRDLRPGISLVYNSIYTTLRLLAELIYVGISRLLASTNSHLSSTLVESHCEACNLCTYICVCL